MQYIKKHIVPISLLGLLMVLYFATRLYNLGALPIFTDEAIYIRWAQIANADAAWRFISLTDGKQPSYVWIAMVLMEFVKDPLIAGRLVSVIAGFFSLIGIFLLSREVFKNTKIGLLTALLYVLYPFALVYDKMALYDSLVAMFIIWSLYFNVLLARHVRLDLALILGMIIGGGMLTKTSANFGFILLPFSLLLFQFKTKNKFDKKRLGKWFVFALIAFILSQVIYAILRLSPFYHIIGEKNLTFIYSFSDWFQSPFAYVFGNLQGLTGWLIEYMTIPFLILAAASFFVSRKFTKEKLLLLVWFVVPFVGLAFFGKVIYPRFILFMTIPLLILGSYTLYCLMTYTKQIWVKALLVFAFTAMWLYADFYILTNFQKAPIANGDRNQFVTGWAAGNGINETAKFLEDKAKDQKIYVGTQGTFGLMPYALEIYLSQNPNIKIEGYWPIEDTPPQKLIEASSTMPTYVIFYQPCPPCEGTGIAPKEWPMTQISQIEKGEGIYYTLYEFKPQQ